MKVPAQLRHDSASSNHGTVYGAAWTTGHINGALVFDGLNDYVDCGNATTLDITNSVSIAAWVKFNDRPTYQTIVAKRGASINETSNYALRTGRTATGKNDEFEFYYRSASEWHIYTTSNVNLTTGSWYHVVVTFTFGSGSSIKCYVNGNLASGSWTTGDGNLPVQINTAPLTIGSLTNDERAKGVLDDVRIYNRVLLSRRNPTALFKRFIITVMYSTKRKGRV